MKMTPSTAAAVSAVAALAVAGITYAAVAPGPAATAAPVLQRAAAPALAPDDGGAGKGDERRERRERREEEGRIEINEREYSAHQRGCVTVISGLGAKTLNIRNESHRTIEVFDGAVCDSGAPIATVAPGSTSEGVRAEPPEGIWVEHGVVASFRVIQHHEGHHEGYSRMSW